MKSDKVIPWIALVAGLIVSSVAIDFISDHVVRSTEMAIFPGLVLGAWVYWPIFILNRVRLKWLLHPPARVYRLESAEIIAKVKTYFETASYLDGIKWRMISDLTEERVIAEMELTGEEKMHFGGEDSPVHTLRMRRFIKCQISVLTQEARSLVKLDFKPIIEGSDYSDCHKVIRATTKDLETALGKEAVRAQSLWLQLPAPPKWLLIASAAMVLLLCVDVFRSYWASL